MTYVFRRSQWHSPLSTGHLLLWRHRMFERNPSCEASDPGNRAMQTRALGVQPLQRLPVQETRIDISRDDLSGAQVGHYLLGRRIGGGGMGTVFAARHVHLDKDFAIKFIRPDIGRLSEARARFDHEVLALGKLTHPNIVNAIDAGDVDGMKYLVTELVQGEDLERIVQQRGAIPKAEACEIIRQAALALTHSHQNGFLHRDIKPSNLILDRSGIVKLMDFGLVRHLTSADQSAAPRMTSHGSTLGTLDFIAPEQAHDAADVDGRADIYSLGCSLIFLLSGNTPFHGSNYSSDVAKLKGHLFETPPWLDHSSEQIPQKLITLIRRMVAKPPAQRPSSAQQVAEELATFASGADPGRLLNPSDSAAPSRESTSLMNDHCSVSVTTDHRGKRRIFTVVALMACCVAALLTARESIEQSFGTSNHSVAVTTVESNPLTENQRHEPPEPAVNIDHRVEQVPTIETSSVPATLENESLRQITVDPQPALSASAMPLDVLHSTANRFSQPQRQKD